MPKQNISADCKFWFEELFYFSGEVLYSVGECLAAVSYFLMLVFNMLSNNLHNDRADDERLRLYQEQMKQRYWEEQEREQQEFEEKQRLYALRFGNWQERHLAAKTLEERDEADTLRDKRGSMLEVVRHDGHTAVATVRQVEQLRFDSNRCRQQISRLHSEADYFRYLEHVSNNDDRRELSGRIRDIEYEISNLERLDKQRQLELQNVNY